MPDSRSGATATAKKSSVLLLDLHPAAPVQGGLFDKVDTPHSKIRMHTVEAVTF